jgi:uncharacterized protein YidB (DUF937 family)
MDDLFGKLTGGVTQRQGSGGIEDLLGGLLGRGGLGSILGGGSSSGGLGSILGGGSSAGVNRTGSGGLGGTLGGGVAALIPTLLPAVLGMLGNKGPNGQSGMHQLIDDMHAGGLGDVAGSWVGTAPSQPISAAQVAQMLTPAQLAELSAKSGIPADQISAGVAAILPHAVSTLTPDGVVPDHAQVQAGAAQLQQALAALTGGLAGPTPG